MQDSAREPSIAKKDRTQELISLTEMLLQGELKLREDLWEIWNRVDRTLLGLEVAKPRLKFRESHLTAKEINVETWKAGCDDYLEQCWKIYLRAWQEQRYLRIPDQFRKAALRFGILPELDEELVFAKEGFERFASKANLPEKHAKQYLHDLELAAHRLKEEQRERVEVFSVDPAEPASGKGKGYPKLKLPPGSQWPNLQITVLDSETSLRIQCGAYDKKVGFDRLGLENRHTGKPNRLWNLLFLAALSSESILTQELRGKSKSVIGKQVSELRHWAQEVFGLPGEPFPKDPEGGWTAAFQLQGEGDHADESDRIKKFKEFEKPKHHLHRYEPGHPEFFDNDPKSNRDYDDDDEGWPESHF